MPFDIGYLAPETKPLTETQRILLRAADEIERRGWCQGEAFGPNGEVCAMGALSDVAPDQNAYRRALNVLTRHVPYYKGMLHSVAQWNDAPGRTKEQVTTALRECARTAAQSEGTS